MSFRSVKARSSCPTRAAARTKLVGGWSVNWSGAFQGGQPIEFGCPSETTAGTGCGALFTGQALHLGLHNDANGKLNWFGNPGAFTQPCVLGRELGTNRQFAGRLRTSDGHRGSRRYHPEFRDPASTGSTCPSSRTSRSRSASACSSVRNSSTSPTTRTSTHRTSAATALWPSPTRATSTARPSAKSVRRAMLPTIRGRSSSLLSSFTEAPTTPKNAGQRQKRSPRFYFVAGFARDVSVARRVGFAGCGPVLTSIQ